MFKRKNNIKTGKELLNERLLNQVKMLEEQNDSLKKELEFERSKPNVGYEEAKNLIAELEQKKQEYQSLMDEVVKIRESYVQKTKEVAEIKKKYEEELNKLISEIKTGTNNKKRKFV